MKWCIERNAKPVSEKIVDGVVTDDPKLYLEICEQYEDEVDGVAVRGERSSFRQAAGLVVDIVSRHVWAKLFFWYRRHVEGKLDDLDKTQRQVKKKKE